MSGRGHPRSVVGSRIHGVLRGRTRGVSTLGRLSSEPDTPLLAEQDGDGGENIAARHGIPVTTNNRRWAFAHSRQMARLLRRPETERRSAVPRAQLKAARGSLYG
jgi:hypothetical protein